MLTVPEAAHRVGRNPETIRRWIRAGKLRSERVVTQQLVDERELESLVAGVDSLPLPPEWDVEPRIDWVRLVREDRERHRRCSISTRASPCRRAGSSTASRCSGTGSSPRAALIGGSIGAAQSRVAQSAAALGWRSGARAPGDQAIERVELPDLGRRAWRIADELGWAKTYDLQYLALAALLDAALATRDRTLAVAAGRLGVGVARLR
jgi:excisionase family DNA binding protein